MIAILRMAVGYVLLVSTVVWLISFPPPIEANYKYPPIGNTTITSQQDCYNSGIEDFVSTTLSSIKDFLIIGDPSQDYLPFDPDDVHDRLENGGSFSVPVSWRESITITGTNSVDMRSSSFSMRIDDSSLATPDLYTYRGHIEFASGKGPAGDSLVALYARPTKIIRGFKRPAFVSGYIVTNVNDPTQPWYFIEPLRPLLSKVLASRENSEMTADELKECLPSQHNAHIVYEAGNDSNFSSQLEPARLAKLSVTQLDVPTTMTPGQVTIRATISDLTNPNYVDPGIINADGDLIDDIELFVIPYAQQNQQTMNPDSLQPADTQGVAIPPDESLEVVFDNITLSAGTYEIIVQTQGNAMKRILSVVEHPHEADPEPSSLSLVAVADSEFYNMYSHTIHDQVWWEGLMEVTNLVDAFYSIQFSWLRIKTRSLEAWTGSTTGPGSSVPDYNGDGTPDINAYTLLCHFAQGYADGNPSARTTPTVPPGSPGLTHLFSGHDLGPIPGESAVSDAGGGFCERTCSKVGNDVVGLAEGIGGLRRSNTNTCRFGSHDDPVVPFPSAQHGLSQHGPKVFQGDPGEPEPNTSYEATLYQRFLLLAHELGHNLGANHSPDPTTIMHTPLQDTIRFKLDNRPYPHGQNNTDEIRNCWKNC